MSLDDDIAPTAVSSGTASPTDALSDRETTKGMETVAWMARAFNRPFTPAAVQARLPRDIDLNAVEGLSRGLEGVGLKSRAVLRDVVSVDPVAFPAIVFRKTARH